ncbi:hypothetical protein AZZ99_001522 [Serratia marcescens]|nr:hypothetical protein AZZ99_001522 [Serratia marcescens]
MTPHSASQGHTRTVNQNIYASGFGYHFFNCLLYRMFIAYIHFCQRNTIHRGSAIDISDGTHYLKTSGFKSQGGSPANA